MADILLSQFAMKLVCKGSIYDKPSFIQLMACYWAPSHPLPENDTTSKSSYCIEVECRDYNK